ncbi:MAG: NlpC/P60 family protein [Candidatus Aminicenantes bacterium]|jgi:cell wall-associated NlpC family hydrolase
MLPAWRKSFICVLVLFILGASCRKRVEIGPPPKKAPAAKEPGPSPKKPIPPAKELPQLGFTIQVGAFSVVGNAIRLTNALKRQNLDAYYFLHPSGLYKVRFGDYATKELARQRAEGLVSDGVIEEYYVVSPEEYSAAKRIVKGEAYLRDELVSTARSFIGIPYSWGGTAPEQGFDCSGLTMAVYELNGLKLPRSSRDQFAVGRPISRNQLTKGDLVFFATSQGKKVTHVGIYTGNGQFIHAPGRDKRIRTDSLTNGYFKTHFLGARTYLD